MLIGLIADVHSNIVALKAVIEELDELGVKIILHAVTLLDTIHIQMKLLICSKRKRSINSWEPRQSVHDG